MIYLIEIDAFDPAANAVTTLRFGSTGYTTTPSDAPPNAHFESGVINAGNYDRHLFAPGTTGGSPTVGAGEIVIANADGELDDLLDLAFDGRALRIYGLTGRSSPWASRTPLLVGTLEQAEFSWTRVTFRIRDRLALLEEPIQAEVYKGTTVAGGMKEAEGTADLKDRPKSLLFGRAFQIPAVLSNAYDLVYQISSRPLASIDAVYDGAVPLTKGTDYPTIAALVTASLSPGTYGTCLAKGSFRLNSKPDGNVTADASEGAAGQRSAARTVRRILEGAGFVAGADFLVSDVDALHAANGAEVGVWLDADAAEILGVATGLLDAIGGYLVPDRLGRYRLGRLTAPAATAEETFDASLALDRGAGLERIATNDSGSGVPAWKVTLHYARAYQTQGGTELDVATSDAIKAFVKEEWRTVTASSDATKAAHKLATEIEANTALTTVADAQAEAARRLALNSIRRDRYRVAVPADAAAAIDLGDTVALDFDRFGLSGGKNFVVIGMEESFAADEDRISSTTLDLWG
ncbi:phage tail protein [Aureimonas psammosilenae]|uniref:phage tail protein n=1 Tax=Aureimonas psammosilenae TaxID=2495496 RepID=UPI00126070A9|nr:phage tail protein [Aureimonas psammosilenae]